MTKVFLFSLVAFWGLAALAQEPAEVMPAGAGTEEDPYRIDSLPNLYWLSLQYDDNDTLKMHYIQTSDIDASATKTWDEGKGFNPIGGKVNSFQGTYNGKGHVISNLYINRPDEKWVGLFSFTSNEGNLDSLGLVNASITGGNEVGGIIGRIGLFSMNHCFCISTDSVTGHKTVGGLVGYNSGDISNCYSRVHVKGDSTVGGFIGENRDFIEKSYAASTIKGKVDTGGFYGKNEFVVKYCFWDKDVSGDDEGVQGTPLSTPEMKNKSNYTNEGWSFVEEMEDTDSIWAIHPNFNDGYPFLTWQWKGPIPDTDPLPDAKVGIGEAVTPPTASSIVQSEITGTTADPVSFSTIGNKTIIWQYTGFDGRTKQQTQTVTVQAETGVNKPEKENIAVYPNPVSNKLYLKTENLQVQSLVIYDILGKIMIQKENIEDHEAIDVSMLAKGMYVVNCTLKGKQEVVSYKIVKK